MTHRALMAALLFLAGCQAASPAAHVTSGVPATTAPVTAAAAGPPATPTPIPAVAVAPSPAHAVSWPTAAPQTARSSVAPWSSGSAAPVASSSAGGFATAAPVVPTTTSEVRQDTVIATLQAGADETAVLAAAGLAKRDSLTLGGRTVLALKVPSGMGLAGAIARLRAVPGVARASVDPIRRRLAYPFTHPDPMYPQQWSHRQDRGNTEGAWAIVPPATQTRVIAAILDTGLDVLHPEFAGRVIGARNFAGVTTPDTNVQDDVGHGTHVAGILGATGDNGVGVAGVAWGVQIMPVRVLGSDGSGDDFDILKGFDYAIHYVPQPDTGARVRVVNMSLGGSVGEVSELWTDAIADATAQGIVVIAAAGNDGLELVGSPANTPGVIAVGSTGTYLSWELLSSYSNYGPRVDLTAPGENILSTAPTAGSSIGKDYATISGTSMASPFVAGVAALVAARYDSSNLQVNATFAGKIKQRLLRAVDDLGVPGQDGQYGVGRINATRAVVPSSIDDAP